MRFVALIALGLAACGGGPGLDYLGPNGDGDDGPGDTLPTDDAPAGPRPSIASVDSAGTHVRQGGHIVFTVAGANLDAVVSGALGATPVTLSAQTPASLTVNADIRHGAPLAEDFASLGLTLHAPGGDAFHADVALVVGIYVSATGDDAATGTDLAPFRSVTQALSVAGAGDSVNVGAGTYDETNGEVWPASGATQGNVPAGIDLNGASGGLTALRSTAAADNAGLIIGVSDETTRLYNLDVSGFAHGIVSRSSTELHTVTVHDNTVDGIDVESDSFFCAPCRSTANGASGIAIAAAAQLSFDSIEIDHNGTGLRVTDAIATGATVNIHDNGLTPVGSDYLVIGPTLRSGVYLDGGRFSAGGGTITGNAVAGITSIGGAVDLGALTISSNGITALTSDNLCQSGDAYFHQCGGLAMIDDGGAVTIAGTQFVSNNSAGLSWVSGLSTVTISANSDVTSGTPDATFASNVYGIYVNAAGVHTPLLASDVEIASNTQFGIWLDTSAALSAFTFARPTRLATNLIHDNGATQLRVDCPTPSGNATWIQFSETSLDGLLPAAQFASGTSPASGAIPAGALWQIDGSATVWFR